MHASLCNSYLEVVARSYPRYLYVAMLVACMHPCAMLLRLATGFGGKGAGVMPLTAASLQLRVQKLQTRQTCRAMSQQAPVISSATDEAPPTHDDSCREFIPVMLELLSAGQAANEAAQATEEKAQAFRDSVEEFLLYGMPKNELEDIMLKTFTEADKDDSGSLDRKVRALAVHVETTSVTTSVWEVLWEIFGFGRRSA